MVARATDGGFEGESANSIRTKNTSFYWFRFHDVAALTDRRDGLCRVVFLMGGYRPALAETSACVCGHFELDTVGYADFSCVACFQRS